MGPQVQDADHRQRVAILDAGGQIPFAGNSQYQFRPFFHNHLAGQGTAGGHRDINPVFPADLHQALNVAATAQHTFVHIAGYLDFTVKQLNTVRQQDQNPVRAYLVFLRNYQGVVHGNKGLADPVLVQPQYPAHKLNHWQQEFDYHQTHEAGKEDILAQGRGQHQQAGSQDGNTGQGQYHQSDNPGQVWMDIGQTAAGNPPGQKDHYH